MANNNGLRSIDLETSYISNKAWNDIPKANFEAFSTSATKIPELPSTGPKENYPKTEEKDTQDNYRNFHLAQYANSFFENVGLQGLRYVFMRNTTWIRRLIWLGLLLAGSAYCMYVTVNNVNNYYSYPTITTTKSHHVAKLDFPAVTVCDYNIFQRSKITQDQYDMLSDMYKPYDFMYNETGKDPGRYNDVDMEQLIINASKSYDLSFSFYQSLNLNQSHTYLKLRDVGNCLTFDPSKDDFFKYQYILGREGGLNLGFPKFGQEWTPGPFMNSQGYIARIHTPDEDMVMVENFGTNIPMGSIVNLIVSRRDVTLLPPPHGQCGTRELQYFDKYTQEACQEECSLKSYISYCGCRQAYMPGGNTTRTCNNIQLRACAVNFFGNLSNVVREVCDCPPECQKTKYAVKVTEAKYTNGTRDTILNAIPGFDVWESAVEIRVYFSKMMYKTQIQEAAYSIEKLLCDVGGAAGLFLGASFMTIMEILDFFLYMGWFASVKAWKKRKQENEVKPSDK